MRRAMLCGFTLVTLAGCRAGDSTTPLGTLPGQPSYAVSDGASGVIGSNPDFFFLPPMAKDPSSHSNYQADGFNPNLQPTVSICELNATSAANVSASTLCKPATTFEATAALSDGKYQYNWAVPKDGALFYRVRILVGTQSLGFTDVATAKNDGFVVVNAGSTLPVKFRIEYCAIVGACASTTVNFAAGGTVSATIDGKSAGVIIPPQPGSSFVTTVTVQECNDLNPSVTDLPTFGPCVRITADPALPPNTITNAATVFICAVGAVIEPGTVDHEQTERLTMHRYDAPAGALPARFAALPHAPACGVPSVATGSLKEMVRSVARGAYASAGRELFAFLAPKPLGAATRRLDVGAGGFTIEFSDFQVALPAMLTTVAGNVKVVDLGGVPVLNARVRFGTSAALCAAQGAGSGTTSNAAGIVTAPGGSLLFACGRGLAGTDHNGPRAGVDPFAPLSMHFGDLADSPDAFPVRTGSLLLPLVWLGSNGYSTYGPFSPPKSTSPAGWPDPIGPTSPGIGSQAPFLGTYPGCAVTSGFNGAATFPENTDVFVTKNVIAPVAGSMTITVRIDNDMRIWVDGVEKTSVVPASTKGAFDAASGFWKHDNCADDGPAVVTLSVLAGTHKIAIWASDRGAVGYLDMQVVLNP